MDIQSVDTKQNNSVLLYNYTKNGMAVLAYGYTISDSPASVEFTGSDITVPIYNWKFSQTRRNVTKNEQRDKKLRLCILSDGKHIVKHVYNEHTYDITIDVEILDEFFQGGDDQVFRVNTINLSVNTIDEPALASLYFNTHGILLDFVETAKKKLVELFDSVDSTEKITKRLIYKDSYWQKMNVQSRSIDNVFLPKGIKEKTIQFITEFLDEDNHKDYIKFGKPYKCNILLHGLPGSGKTSLISAIAGEIDSNIGVLSLNHKTDDMDLSEALRSFAEQDYESDVDKCRILVIEDIDCMFTGRKKDDDARTPATFSGILNCLDGMCRMEGIIIFMTANDITKLDKALIRPGRVDYKLEFKYADKYQVKQMYKTFYGDEVEHYNTFKRKYGSKEFTTASLYQFFFQYRKSAEDMIANLDEFGELISEKTDIGLGENLYN